MTEKPDKTNPGDITLLLSELQGGRFGAREDLFQAVYAELRRLAGVQMADERRGHTLQPTALVHEAFLRLVGEGAPWKDRAHFLNTAARAMRHILVDYARTRLAKKRGGGAARVTLADTDGALDPGDEVIMVHDALGTLEGIDEDKARVVELRYFAGLTVEETARVMDVTERTVYRLWERARVWLLRAMS